MEEPVFVKCEPAWSSDTEEPTNFEHFEPEAPMEQMKEETDPELREPGPSQLPGYIKGEVMVEEHITQELVPFVKEENSVENFPKSLENRYQCQICNATFAVRTLLSRHMLIHTGQRPHRCNMCNTTFPLKSTLVKHMFTHTRERLNRCCVCNATFLQKAHLGSHMLSHTEDRPHRCNVCIATFVRGSNLRRHMLTHTRPHRCDVCNATFLQKAHLESHMLAHD